ncbi:MAG TPA: M48 family metallopeptidase [Burkholderiales bacterium]|nr:M48 family metallopeptidase [Burkholderiales bacterium]
MKLIKVALALATVGVMAACANAPVTNRKQLMLVSEDQAINASAQAYTQVLQQERGKLDVDPALERRVQAITSRLVAQAVKYRPETDRWNWEVHVINEPNTLNAWAMAGGKMAIYSGIINKLNLTDDEIAQIMGHEIGHALAKHTAERMSTAALQQMGLQIAGSLLGSGGVANQAALQAAAIATTVGFTLPNSRTQEAEADRIGIELAAKAGYDPRAAVTLWQKMIAATGQRGKSDFLSTHPAGEKRIESLQALVPKMMPYYQDPSPRPSHPVALMGGWPAEVALLGFTAVS